MFEMFEHMIAFESLNAWIFECVENARYPCLKQINDSNIQRFKRFKHSHLNLVQTFKDAIIEGTRSSSSQATPGHQRRAAAAAPHGDFIKKDYVHEAQDRNKTN